MLLSPAITFVDPDNSINPDNGGVLRSDNQKNSLGDAREDWKSTTFATAKLLLRSVKDSADAFGPLKSVSGDLCAILENDEVRFTSHVHNSHNGAQGRPRE